MQEQILTYMRHGAGPHPIQVLVLLGMLAVAVWAVSRCIKEAIQLTRQELLAQKKSASVGADTDQAQSACKKHTYTVYHKTQEVSR